MLNRSAPLLLILLAGGCNSSSSEPLPGLPLEERDGSRLRVDRGMGSNPILDTELGIPCRMTSWNGTEAWCVPPIPETSSDLPFYQERPLYLDAQCSRLVVPSADPTAKFSAYPSVQQDCTAPTFYRLGDVHEGTIYFRATDGNGDTVCVPYTPRGIWTFYAAGPVVPLETFVAAEQVHGEGERLEEVFWKASDGSVVTTRNTLMYPRDANRPSPQVAPLYFDSVRSEMCTPMQVCDGKVRCMPFNPRPFVSGFRGGWVTADAACTQFVAFTRESCFLQSAQVAGCVPGLCGCSYARIGEAVSETKGLVRGNQCLASWGWGADLHITEILPDETFAEVGGGDAP